MMGSQTQSLKPTIYLQHLCEMDSCLLTNRFIYWTINVQNLQRAVIPIQDTCNDNHAICVNLVPRKIELLQRLLNIVFSNQQQTIGKSLCQYPFTTTPFVNTLLLLRFRYFKVWESFKLSANFSAPELAISFPCRLTLNKSLHFASNSENVYIPVSPIWL